MLERASGQFIIDGQVEDILGGISGAARIARISQTCQFRGQLEGESMAEFTAVLPREGDGSFHGFQRVSGTLGEREGSFVLSVTGEIHKGQPRGSWSIVPRSGSGDFVHIRGGGTFSLPDGKPGTYRLEFDLRKPRVAKSAKVDPPEETPVVMSEQPVETDGAIPTPATREKPIRKPRARKAEPTVEAANETPVKRARTRKVDAAPAAAVATEAPAKRTRSRKVKPSSEPIAVSEPPGKRRRSRKTEPAVSAQSATESAPTTKRSRKPTPTTEPAIEPAVAEPIPTKVTRPKKATSPVPITLPVAEPAPARKRRAKAA